jgi:hypothetical protein
MIPKQKLNTQEAAAYLGIQPNTLEVWRCKHKGPRYAKLGTRVLYDKADLDEFFASRSIETLESAKRDRRYRNQR